MTAVSPTKSHPWNRPFKAPRPQPERSLSPIPTADRASKYPPPHLPADFWTRTTYGKAYTCGWRSPGSENPYKAASHESRCFQLGALDRCDRAAFRLGRA